MWAWLTTAGSAHAHTVSIDYTDQDGNAAQNTGNVSTNGVVINRVLRMPWAAGDNGIRDLEGYKVNGITSATGAVSVMVLRPLWKGKIFANTLNVFGPDLTGMPQVFSDSALMMLVLPESTATGLPELLIEIAEGT